MTLYLNTPQGISPKMSQRYQPEVITTSDYQPHFYPTGQHNDRAVRCNNCRVQLAKGQGRQWDYSDFAYGYVRTAHPKYYCPACHADRKAMFDIEPELYALTSNITAWCKAYINLSMGGHAGDHIQRMVYACGLRGLEIARRVWDGLPQLEECSYESVLGLARRVARSVMTQESEDPA